MSLRMFGSLIELFADAAVCWAIMAYACSFSAQTLAEAHKTCGLVIFSEFGSRASLCRQREGSLAASV